MQHIQTYRTRVLLFLTLLFSTAVFSNYDVLKIPRVDGSILTAYLKYPDSLTDLSIVLNISGSACQSSYNTGPVSPIYKQLKIAQLSVEKYGIDENFTIEQCGDLYRRHNNIFQRAEDHNLALNYISKHYNLWNGRVYIIAGSEGSVVAPLIGRAPVDIKGVALWAGGRSMTMAEEFFLNLEKGNDICRDTPPSREEYQKKFKDILAQNRSTKLWCSTPSLGSVNSYQWWAHILDYDPTNDFLSLSARIFVGHGTRDRMVPVETTLGLLKAFNESDRKNLSIKVYEDLDHGCHDSRGENHCEKVFSEIYGWLFEQIRFDNSLGN